MLRVTRTSEANEDLVAIWEFIADHNPVAADSLSAKIEQGIRLLAGMPEMGTRVGSRSADVRYYTVGSYVIFYRIETRSLQILRVLHGARNFPPLLEGN